MQATCQACGRPFEAKRQAAKFCGDTCRKRAQRAPAVPATPRPVERVERASESGLVAVVRRDLLEAGVLDTIAGQQAMAIAERIASPHETGAAVASLSKQLQAVVSEALGSVKSVDPLDQLRARRDAKRVG